MKRYVMIYLTMFLLTVSGLYAKTSIEFKILGNLSKIDTVVQTQSYSIPYASCDSLVLLVETRDTLVVESVMFQYGTDNGFTVSKDTVQGSLTIPYTAIIPLKALPVLDIYRLSRVQIKVKGLKPKSTEINFIVGYIRKD